MRCECRASLADMRRSHSSAIAVARLGLEEGIASSFVVPGLRTGRPSSQTPYLPSTKGLELLSTFGDKDKTEVVT